MRIRIQQWSILLALFFILFFPRDRFVQYEPYLVWKIDKDNPAEQKPFPSYITPGRLKKNYFVKQNSITFFSNNTKILSQHKIPAGYFISCGTGDFGGLLYSNSKEKISFLDKYKGITWEFQTFAYPFVTLNQQVIFLITGENGGYGVLNMNGTELGKTISTGMFITTFDIASSTNLILVGFANGYVKLYNENLTELWFKKFLDSNIQITKKTAVSSKGNYFAVLAGLEKEYLYLLDRNGSQLLKLRTDENRNRTIDLLFSMDEKYLLEESETGFRLYSTTHKKCILNKRLFPPSKKRKIVSMDISFNGQFVIIAYHAWDNLVHVELMNSKGISYYHLIFDNQQLLVSFGFNKNNFMIELEKQIYLYGF